MNWLKPKILIVDDDPVYLAVINQKFKNHGLQNVAIFDNVIEGIKSDFGKPDIVFVDFHMNDINGARASKMFSKKWRNTRIVLISNSESIKKKVKKSRYGIDDTVLKEADFSELLAQVRIASRNIMLRGIWKVSVAILILVALYFLFIY
jgi:DNA-binding response OmpR family regulator